MHDRSLRKESSELTGAEQLEVGQGRCDAADKQQPPCMRNWSAGGEMTPEMLPASSCTSQVACNDADACRRRHLGSGRYALSAGIPGGPQALPPRLHIALGHDYVAALLKAWWRSIPVSFHGFGQISATYMEVTTAQAFLFTDVLKQQRCQFRPDERFEVVRREE